MGQLSKKLRNAETPEGVKHLAFWCQGCRVSHSVSVGQIGTWGWNGDAEKPTFTPSVLVRSGHYASHARPDDSCWCKYNAEQVANGGQPTSFKCGVCHSFVTDGRIQFLGDCTHELAGQTVDLPDWPDDVC